MQFSLQPDTLAFQMARPGNVPRDMSDASVYHIAKKARVLMECPSIGHFTLGDDSAKPCVSPEGDALRFYMLNHAMAKVRLACHPLQSLGAYLPVVEAYNLALSSLSTRMFFYLLLICTRESRHAKSSGDSPQGKELIKKYGIDCWTFTETLKGLSPLPAANKFMASPPNVALGPYVRYLADLFNTCSFGSAFGGSKWGAIAELLRDFVIGKLSAEMMLDTAFTLAHNTAPIFNKSMLFDMYTSELAKILDVQRSGQIPQYVASSPTIGQWLKPTLHVCRSALQGDFAEGVYVDWYLVEELGALNSYPTEKAAQTKLYGAPAKHKAKLAVEQLKKEQAAVKATQEAKSLVTLYPGCTVKVVERDYA